jgi:hypothetical protein
MIKFPAFFNSETVVAMGIVGKVIDPSAERPSGKIRETLYKYLAEEESRL